MDEILAGIPGCICYLDDILVVGGSQEEHDQRLDIVLDRLNKRYLTKRREVHIQHFGSGVFGAPN